MHVGMDTQDDRPVFLNALTLLRKPAGTVGETLDHGYPEWRDTEKEDCYLPIDGI